VATQNLAAQVRALERDVRRDQQGIQVVIRMVIRMHHRMWMLQMIVSSHDEQCHMSVALQF